MSAQEMPDLVAGIRRLADLAEETCSQLREKTKECNHDMASEDFVKIADELALLSVTLRRLEETMSPKPKLYTDTFRSDLSEIARELDFVLDEINECCDAIYKADSTTTVPWMFKKSRVTKLHKHIEALKTTLIVMRHVLWEGTDCEKDGNLLSGRAFLEAAIARNRDTISELYNMDELASFLDRTPSTMSRRTKSENGPSSTCVCGEPSCNCLLVGDVVSPSKSKNLNSVYETHLNRRFSKRGVRLGVHSSILGHGAHNVPEYLKQKWRTQARSGDQHDQFVIRPVLTGLSPNLSTIPESESIVQNAESSKDMSDENLDETRPKTASSWSSIFGSVIRTNSSGSWTKRSPEQKAHDVGSKVKQAIKKISHLSIISRNKADTDTVNVQESRGKENEHSGSDIDRKRRDYNGERKRDHILRTIYYGPGMCPPHWSDGEDTEAQQSGLA